MARPQLHTYDSPWPVYAMAWSQRPDRPFRLAFGSFLEDFSNFVDIVQLDLTASAPVVSQFSSTSSQSSADRFVRTGEVNHTYPATKIMWSPDRTGRDLLASSGDYLRLWVVDDNDAQAAMPSGTAEGAASIELAACLSSNKTSEFCAPLTAFDWNETDPSIVGTASIDTTATIWNVETQQATTQIIAHDKEVYDIAFTRGTDVFASVGADGSCRMFDLRSLDHSTIIFESKELTPLLRLCWNKQDPNYLATMELDSNKVILIDIRVPSLPAAELTGHTGSVNALAWAPHNSCNIASAADDKQAFIWDLSPLPAPIAEPVLGYEAPGEINNLQWSTTHSDWVSIAYDKQVQLLHV